MSALPKVVKRSERSERLKVGDRIRLTGNETWIFVEGGGGMA